MWKVVFIGCLTFVMTGCGFNQHEKKMVGKWKPSINAKKEIEKRAGKHFKKMSEKHIAKLTQGIQNKTKGMVFAFKADGKYEVQYEKDGEAETGTWKIINGGQVLFIKSDKGKQQNITIKSLSDQKAELSINETQDLTLLRAN
ncbi:hypothetical protein BKI52_09320 [marine bacterium AO1-C]|nr:hypothetical protein BKI52_09320 [marine bacterium AO1-C]